MVLTRRFERAHLHIANVHATMGLGCAQGIQ